jgi:hypothetical protein
VTDSVSGTVLSAPHSPPLDTGAPPVMVDIFATDETVPVAIKGTPFTVLLLRELDWGQQAELEAAALKGIERDTLETAINTKQNIILDTSKQRMLHLALRVLRWNVRRHNPATDTWEPVPLPEHLPERIMVMKRLRPKWARQLIAMIDKLDEENNADEPEMPMLLAPEDEPQESAPKASTSDGATNGLVETSTSASTWAGVSQN